MPAYISEKFNLDSDSCNNAIEFFLNQYGSITVQERTEDVGGAFFTITKLEWDELKKWIDDQIKKTESG